MKQGAEMRLIIVSNRLPVTISEVNNNLLLKVISGGLVTGISSYLSSIKSIKKGNKTDYKWVGWPGKSLSVIDQKIFLEKAEKMNLNPIFLTDKVMDKFYLDFCNKMVICKLISTKMQ